MKEKIREKVNDLRGRWKFYRDNEHNQVMNLEPIVKIETDMQVNVPEQDRVYSKNALDLAYHRGRYEKLRDCREEVEALIKEIYPSISPYLEKMP